MGSNPARSATKYGPDDEFVVLLRTVELRSERRLSPSIMNSSCILACERYRSHAIRCWQSSVAIAIQCCYILTPEPVRVLEI